MRTPGATDSVKEVGTERLTSISGNEVKAMKQSARTLDKLFCGLLAQF